MTVPQFKEVLPEYFAFITRLSAQVEAGNLTGWPDFSPQVRTFFTPDMLEKVEAAAPGWKEMSSYRDMETTIHVTSVFVSLLMLPEYRQASPEQQNLALWIVLFHDVEKKLQPGERDCTHGFRSAALCGSALPRLGFDITEEPAKLTPWITLTTGAVSRQKINPIERLRGRVPKVIQDNSKLPEIVSGIEHHFGRGTPAALIVKSVLFHMSINVVEDWPQSAPLTGDEIQRYISPGLYPLLKMMMLADNDAWSFFDPETRAQQRAETLAVFEKIG